MMPILYDLRIFGYDLSLPTYGLLLAIAFLAALAVAVRGARREGIETTAITDIWIISLLAGVIGAKLLLYLLDWRYYFDNPAAILASLRSAGVWYGGLLVAVAACLIVVKRRGLDGWVIGDIAAPAISLGQAIGRLGCFAAGCCYGKACELPWAVTFSNPRAHEITGVPLSVPLHPTQLYHALADFTLFLILLRLVPRRRFNGQALLAYLILYAILRGVIEAFRGDPRGALGALSTSQILGAAILLVAGWLYVKRSRTPSAARVASAARTAAAARPAPRG